MKSASSIQLPERAQPSSAFQRCIGGSDPCWSTAWVKGYLGSLVEIQPPKLPNSTSKPDLGQVGVPLLFCSARCCTPDLELLLTAAGRNDQERESIQATDPASATKRRTAFWSLLHPLKVQRPSCFPRGFPLGRSNLQPSNHTQGCTIERSAAQRRRRLNQPHPSDYADNVSARRPPPAALHGLLLISLHSSWLWLRRLRAPTTTSCHTPCFFEAAGSLPPGERLRGR